MQNTEQKEIKQADAVTVMDNNQGRKFKALFLSNIVAIPGVNLTCDINNEKEARGIRDAFDNNEQIVVVASKSIVETPQIEDFLEFGCLCTIKRIMPQGSTVRVLLTGDARVKINKFEQGELFTVYGEIELDKNTTTPHAYQLMSEIKAGMRTLADGRALQGQLQAVMLDDEIEPALFSDLLVHFLAKEDLALQRELLVETDVEKRLEILNKQMTIVVTNFLTHKEIEEKVNDNIAKTQKEIYLREQLHVINEELNGEVDEIEEYTKKVKAIGLPKDSEEKVIKEINRLGKLPFGSPEIGYIRNFLDTVLELPWTKRTEVNIDINKAREVLNSEHYALDEVKQRILETLAVIKLTGKVNAQIICLVGPPGVGKTSIAKSVAKAMGREFVQVSLGGVSDESVIRGHRRTYVGAMCGRILAGMKQAGTINPVFLLDEIDKLSRDVRGDPSSALLEVLDPAQNDHFKDNFLELPYDLSQVMFILTANDLSGIPGPLRDRMEIIKLRPYTEIEKIHIAKEYLIPKQEELAGIPKGTLKLDDKLLGIIINEYTFEGGVRSLERKIAEICRKYASFVVTGEKFTDVNENNLTDYLGHNRYKTLDIFKGGNVGEVVALSVYGQITGDTMLVEAIISEGNGQLQLTCQPGKMMQESSKIAYSLIKSRAEKWSIPYKKIKESNVHLSIPGAAGGVEGPSAGITMTTAMVSAFTGIPVKEYIGMTGEISLGGRVFPIGGVRDKLIAGARVGLKECIIPKDNEDDLWDLPEEVKSKLTIHLVSNIDEVLAFALKEPLKPIKAKTSGSKKEQEGKEKSETKKTSAKKSTKTNTKSSVKNAKSENK